MAKPTITTRTSKGAALTYSELDTNFTNLRDATISIDANGSVIVLDLNDTLTLSPGSNISFTVVGSALTINASGGDQLASNNISVGDNISGLVNITSQPNNLGLTLNSNGGSSINLYDAGNILISGSTIQFSGNQGITLSPTTGLNEWPVYGSPVFFAVDYIRLKVISTTERNSLSAANGMLIYNTTLNKFQGYANGAWYDLH